MARPMWKMTGALGAALLIGAGCAGQPSSQRLASSSETKPAEARSGESQPSESQPQPTAAASDSKAATDAIPMPTAADAKPVDYPGLHNVVAYAPGVLSGSVPEGEEGFATLKKMGIKTVMSVDGAEPELDLAQRYGLKYVHLPITYAGFDEKRKLELTKAVRDLPRPIYLHCHHGKHRSAGAAGAAVVSLGWSTPDEAVARMKVSGTAPDYKGLYACTASAVKVMPAILDAINGNFPAIVRPEGTVKTMIEVDIALENLKAIQKAGWKAPPDHPSLVGAAEAGRLADYYRFLHADKESSELGTEYLQMMLTANKEATDLEDALTNDTPPAELDKKFKAVTTSCKTCHVKYRD